MNAIKAAIYAHLTNTTAVTDIASSRGYPHGHAPQDPTYPYWTYQIVAAPEIDYSNASTGYDKTTVLISSYDKDDDSAGTSGEVGATELADAIHDELHQYTGTLGNGANTVTCQGAFSNDDMRDLAMDREAAGERSVHIVEESFDITHSR